MTQMEWHEAARSAQQVFDFQDDFGKSCNGKGIAAVERQALSEFFTDRISAHQDDVMLQIFDPNLTNSQPGINGKLHVAVITKGGVRDFEHEKYIFRCRMS